MTSPLPSLDAPAFLDLMQSLLLHHSRSGNPFPIPHRERAAFGEKRCFELCSPDVWKAAAHDLAVMFMLSEASETEGILGLHPDLPMRERAEQLCALWCRGPRNIAFSTSGSTGIPRLCVHSEADLQQEALCLKDMLAGKKAFLSTVPPHHLYGFTFGLYLPLLCGVPVERTLPLSSLVVSKIRKDQAVVGVPLLWDAVARGHAEPAPPNVTLLSASAPVRPETLSALERRGYALLDIFGSSETGVIGIRHHTGDPYRLLPYFRRGTEGQELLRTLPDGSLAVCPLMDALRWENAREFHPEGRKDHAVQVGGVNVYPALIERRLRLLPGIAACAVRLTKHGEDSRLKAFIVMEKGVEEASLRKELRDFLQNLPPEERPVQLSFGTELPRNAMGKLCDWQP